MMAEDAGAEGRFVCKIVDGKPCFVELKGTRATQSVFAHVVERWISDDKKYTFDVCEISYTKTKTLEFLAKKGDLYVGPDMYHLYLDNLLLVNIWQPMYLGATVELCDVTECPERTELLQATESVNAILRVRLHAILLKTYKQTVHLETGACERFKITFTSAPPTPAPSALLGRNGSIK